MEKETEKLFPNWHIKVPDLPEITGAMCTLFGTTKKPDRVLAFDAHGGDLRLLTVITDPRDDEKKILMQMTVTLNVLEEDYKE